MTFADLDPDRVLLVGDSHGNAAFMRAACNRAAQLGIPVLLQLGDFGLWPGVSGNEFLAEVGRAASTAGVHVCFIDGNHDDHAQIGRWPTRFDGPVPVGGALTYLARGRRWTWAGVRFGALGGAFSVDWRGRVPGQSWWPEEVVTDADVERLGPDRLDVLVCHDSPAELTMRSRFILAPADQSAADESRRHVQEAVDVTRPRLVVHGHWHHRQSRALHFIDQTATEADLTGRIHWADTVVEGLGADVSRDWNDARAVLHLPSLEVTPAD